MYFVNSVSIYYLCIFFFFFKQKTAYEMRISDWSSDVCSSDLDNDQHCVHRGALSRADHQQPGDKTGNPHGGQVDHSTIKRPTHKHMGDIDGKGVFNQANDIDRKSTRLNSSH